MSLLVYLVLLCKVSVLFSAVYATLPYYVVLYIKKLGLPYHKLLQVLHLLLDSSIRRILCSSVIPYYVVLYMQTVLII